MGNRFPTRPMAIEARVPCRNCSEHPGILGAPAGTAQLGMFRSNKRLGGRTLGILVDELTEPYQASICEGIAQGVAAGGESLLIFVGGDLSATTSPTGAPLRACRAAQC
jgi:hypothetical protein